MAFQEVTDLNPDTTIALGGTNKKTGKANPSRIEGYYLGKRKVDNKKAKSGFCYIYVFQTPKGTIGVWGKTDLDRKMEQVPVGVMTLAAFDKMVPTPNGDMYKFKVSVDKSNTIEVDTLEAGSSDAGAESNDDDNNVSEDYADASEEANDEDLQQAAALLAAERQAKVQALLKGKGSKTK